MWRHLLGVCGGTRGRKSNSQSLSSPSPVNASKSTAEHRAVVDVSSRISPDSSSGHSCCYPGVANTIDASSSLHGSTCGSSVQLHVSLMSSCASQTAGYYDSTQTASTSPCMARNSSPECPTSHTNQSQQQPQPAPEPEAQGPMAVAVITHHDSPLSTAQPGPSLHANARTQPPDGPTDGLLQIALSAYNIRDIAECDPAVRMRNLEPLLYGPGTAVYKGTWQGLPMAVKFMLYRGGAGGGSRLGAHDCSSSGGCDDVSSLQRDLAALLTTHCMPLRSHLVRVYACDVSAVVQAAPPPPPPPRPSHHPPPPPPQQDISNPGEAGWSPPSASKAQGARVNPTKTPSPSCETPAAALSVRPWHPQPAPPPSSTSHSTSCTCSGCDTGYSNGSDDTNGTNSTHCSNHTRASTSVGHCMSPCCRCAGPCCTPSTSPFAASLLDNSVHGGTCQRAAGAARRGGGGSRASAGGNTGGGTDAAAHFHFSSAVFCEDAGPQHPHSHAKQLLPPASNPGSNCCKSNQTTDNGITSKSDSNRDGNDGNSGDAVGSACLVPGRTLQGLLRYLGARPGDFLVHCVMELASGGDLWYGIRSVLYDMNGPMGPRGAVRMILRSARGIAQGLHQLHQAGDVHGGLTPRNVLLNWNAADGLDEGDEEQDMGRSAGEAGRARLYRRRCRVTTRVADCGLRRLVLGPAWRRELEGNEELRRCTAPELLAEAPEAEVTEAQAAATGEQAAALGGRAVAGGEVRWSHGSDIYSFGAVLYCMCTGRLPPDSPHPPATLSSAPHPAPWPSHVWQPLRSLGEACMAGDPAGRPSSGEVVKTLLTWEHRLLFSSRTQHHATAAAAPVGAAGAAAGHAVGAGRGAPGVAAAALAVVTGPGSAFSSGSAGRMRGFRAAGGISR
ncbi:hypothetical protein Agub_g194, partial [Astrephomene gubernaculifera]